ncbi:hypothetical protein D3C71_1952390 [compost metagenome]
MRLFFIAQSEPVQKPANRRAMDFDTALCELDTQFVQGHFAVESDALADPVFVGRKLGSARRMALPGRGKRTR